MAEEDVDLVLEWRNSDRVRTKMFEHHLIAKEDHVRWFKSLEGNLRQKCWMFLYQRKPIGVITVKLVDEQSDTWIWGCYLGPMKAVPQAGTIMGFVALEHYFETMKLKKVIGEAVAANERSLEFNARLGFATEKKFLRTNSMGQPIEAVLLTFLRQDWPAHKERLLKHCFA